MWCFYNSVLKEKGKFEGTYKTAHVRPDMPAHS